MATQQSMAVEYRSDLSVKLSNYRTKLSNKASYYFTQKQVAAAIGISIQSYILAETYGVAGRKVLAAIDQYLKLSTREAIRRIKLPEAPRRKNLVHA